MNKVFLSIIIPTLNRRRYIVDCLRELGAQMREFSDVEIVVVDNASTDDTAEAVKNLIAAENIACQYVLEERRGSNIARNRGRLEARGEVLAIIDDDALPHAHWLARTRQHFLDKQSDCFAGRVELRLDAPLPDWFPADLHGLLGKTDYGDQTRAMTADELPQSNNCAFRAEIFDALGGFNPDSLIYGDETEFFQRAREKGYSFLYRQDISVDHCVPAERLSKPGLYRKGFLWGKGSAMYWMLFTPSQTRRLLRIAEYSLRTGYIGLRWLTAPSFGRAYTFNFNRGHVRQLINGIKSPAERR